MTLTKILAQHEIDISDIFCVETSPISSKNVIVRSYKNAKLVKGIRVQDFLKEPYFFDAIDNQTVAANATYIVLAYPLPGVSGSSPTTRTLNCMAQGAGIWWFHASYPADSQSFISKAIKAGARLTELGDGIYGNASLIEKNRGLLENIPGVVLPKRTETGLYRNPPFHEHGKT